MDTSNKILTNILYPILSERGLLHIICQYCYYNNIMDNNGIIKDIQNKNFRKVRWLNDKYLLVTKSGSGLPDIYEHDLKTHNIHVKYNNIKKDYKNIVSADDNGYIYNEVHMTKEMDSYHSFSEHICKEIIKENFYGEKIYTIKINHDDHIIILDAHKLFVSANNVLLAYNSLTGEKIDFTMKCDIFWAQYENNSIICRNVDTIYKIDSNLKIYFLESVSNNDIKDYYSSDSKVSFYDPYIICVSKNGLIKITNVIDNTKFNCESIFKKLEHKLYFGKYIVCWQNRSICVVDILNFDGKVIHIINNIFNMPSANSYSLTGKYIFHDAMLIY